MGDTPKPLAKKLRPSAHPEEVQETSCRESEGVPRPPISPSPESGGSRGLMICRPIPEMRPTGLVFHDARLGELGWT